MKTSPLACVEFRSSRVDRRYDRNEVRGWSRIKIQLLGSAVALLYAASAGLSYLLLGNASEILGGTCPGFCSGAILGMLADPMMPEAFERGGKQAGIFTVLGFELTVTVVLLEKLEGNHCDA